MSSAIATPTGSDAAKSGAAVKSDTKKSGTSTPSKTSASGLSAREEELFKVAMLHCLKSGVPEIDIDKFIVHGDFKAKKTAQNMWGTIKGKVFPKKEAVEGEPGDATPKTPKTPKAKATPKKRTKKEDGDDDEAAVDSASPKKRVRKSPVKKTPTKVVAKEDEVTALVEATKDVDREESAVKAEVTDE